VLAVLGFVVLRPSPPAPQSQIPTPDTNSAAASTQPAQPAEVNVTITNELADFETADTTTVYSFGKPVGTLRVNASSPHDELPLSAEPGDVDYQLTIEMVGVDGNQYTLNGAGTVTAFEGARYAVDITKNSAGNFVATLTAASGT